MKREEMIDEMSCVIYAFAATYPQYPLEKLAELANLILEKQEELGMLAPWRNDESPVGYGAAYLSEEECIKNRFKFKHSWEDKDA